VIGTTDFTDYTDKHRGKKKEKGKNLDSRLRGNDKEKRHRQERNNVYSLWLRKGK
jgi:hypothetical protein